MTRLALWCACWLAAACGMPRATPPGPERVFPIPRPAGARASIVASKKFSVTVLDFGTERTDVPEPQSDATPLRWALPAVLATELHNEGRFAVYEGGNLRLPLKDEIINEKTAARHTDGYVSGTITTHERSKEAAPERACFDVRLSNAHNHELLFARSTCTALALEGGTTAVDRAGLKALAVEMSKAMRQVEPARVLSVSDRQVVINKGASDWVRSGMVAYLVATGDTVTGPGVSRLVAEYTGVDTDSASDASEIRAVGELYVISVEDGRSLAYLFQGEYAMPGDTVYFK